MTRRTLLALAVTALLAAPAAAQPPVASDSQTVTAPATARDGAPPLQDGGGRRGFGARRGGGGFFGRRGGFSGPVGPGALGLAAGLARPPARPVGPPPLPADAALMRDFEGSVSAVFDPGSKSARVKLIETDSHGVEGLRYLKPGQVYRDGWRLASVAAREVVLRKGGKLLHVDISRGWTVRPPPIQPAVLVQPSPAAPTPTPGRNVAAPRPQSLRGLGGPNAGFGGPGRGQGRFSGNPALGLSNARPGGPAPPAPVPPAPSAGTLRVTPDGMRVFTDNLGNTTVTTPNGQTVQLPPGTPLPPF